MAEAHRIAPAPAPYAPRHVAGLGDWDVAGLRLKIYSITLAADGTVPLTSAAAYARGVLPAAERREGGSSGLGFVILHRGADATWLLMHWWAHGDICCGRLARAEAGTSIFASLDDRPLVACVWELAVIAHERRAWVETMLTEAPAPKAYLARRMPDGAV